MYPIKKVIISLDLSEMDEILFRYVRFLSNYFEFESITLAHVIEEFDMPEELLEELRSVDIPVSDMIANELKEKATASLGEDLMDIADIRVTEGDPVEELSQYIYHEKPDFVIAGKKNKTEGHGITARRLLKVSGSSIMFVPDNTIQDLSQILVAIDFSKSSQNAFRQAARIAKRAESRLSCQYVYNLPLSYFPHKPHDKFEKSMQDYGTKEFKKFLKKIDYEESGISCQFSLDEEGRPVKKIFHHANSIKAGLIVIGARGSSTSATTIVGSIPEKMAGYESNIPVLIVKDKFDIPGFLKNLFEGTQKK